MLNREPDDETSILREIQAVKQKLASLDEDVYELSMKRKFLNHRLADLEYNLSQIRNGTEHDV